MSNNIKVLHVSPSYYPAIQFGGPIQSVHLLNKTLIAQSLDVDVITTNAGLEQNKAYSSHEWVILDGVRIKYFPYYGYIHYNFSLQLYRYLQNAVKEYDLVHITAVWNFPVWATSNACRKAGIPYVISPRGTIYPETVALKSTLFKKVYYRLLARQCLESAAAIHYTAADEQDKVSNFLKLTTPSFVIPNGIDLNSFASTDQIPSFSTFFPEISGKKYILFLSRINVKKGLDLLINAFAEVSNKFPDVLLVVAGPDNEGYSKEVKEHLTREGLLSKAFFPGMLTGDVKLVAYRDAEIFTLPSYSENFGMSVVEAMACGTPVVISDQVGIAREIENRQAGIVVPTYASELSKAIIHLLTHPDKQITMGNNGLRMVKDYYDIKSVSEHMSTQYQHILSRKFIAKNQIK